MKKIPKNIIATALAAMTAVSAASVSFSASAATDKIRLIVKNETYSVSEGAAWEGILYDKTVDISEGKDALSTVTAALNADNVQLTVNDTQWGSYIAAVNGIAENDAAQYSGWMGVQNDWVVNNNLAYIFLRDGDTFELTYSVKIGSDIGADWNNPTTALKALSIDGPALNEEFTPSNTDYTVTIGNETKNILNEYEDDGREPSAMAKGMSWIKTSVKLMVDPSDKTVAGLMTDGCNMGVKSLNGYLNEYSLADSKAQKLTGRLIDIEERMADSMAEFL